MKDDDLPTRMRELDKMFADVRNDVLMRFVNRNSVVCKEFSRDAILRAMADRPSSGREQLKSFLGVSVPEALRRKPEWFWGTRLKSRYEKHISCGDCCVFDPPLPQDQPSRDDEYVENAQEVARRDRELLKQLQQNDENIIRRELLEEAEFNTACGDSESARAEAAFRDGVVNAKLAELEHYVKEQMAELRRENLAWLESLRKEILRQCGPEGQNPEESDTPR